MSTYTKPTLSPVWTQSEPTPNPNQPHSLGSKENEFHIRYTFILKYFNFSECEFSPILMPHEWINTRKIYQNLILLSIPYLVDKEQWCFKLTFKHLNTTSKKFNQLCIHKDTHAHIHIPH